MSAPTAVRVAPAEEEADWVEVERLLRGAMVAADALPASVQDAVVTMTKQGSPAATIATRIGTTARTVVRNRTRARAAGLLP